MKNRREFLRSSMLASGAMLAADAGDPDLTNATDGTVMAIAAHPGDALFTMGLPIAQHIKNGGQGIFLSLSLGERGNKDIPTKEYGEVQRTATIEAANLLGADAEFLTYPDGQVPFSEEASLAVCDQIRKFQPSIIITHWKGSWHKDHRNCYKVVQDARFYAGLNTLNRDLPAHFASKLYYAENWEDMEGFQGDTYLDVSTVAEQWEQACELFPMWRGETGFRYHHYYQSLAILRGCLGSFPKAVMLMSGEGQHTKTLNQL